MAKCLLTPGPTPIPERVLRAMAAPMVHHRTAPFRERFREAAVLYQELVDSDQSPIFITGSGTAAMEAALLNTCVPGDLVVVVSAGKFGLRWAKIARAMQYQVVEIEAPWGETVDLQQLEQTLSQNKGAKAFCVQLCETSTGVLHPLDQILDTVQRVIPDCLTLVDGISGVGTLPLSVQRFPIDLLVGASQKALMVPPGLAMVVCNQRTWDRIETVSEHRATHKLPTSYYFDLLAEREAQSKGSSAWTPATTLVLGLREALNALAEEGHEHVYERHALLASQCRSTLEELGFTLLAVGCHSPGVTAGIVPQGIDADRLKAHLSSEYDVWTAGGQGPLKGRIIRFGHMGGVTHKDLERGLTSLRSALTDLASS